MPPRIALALACLLGSGCVQRYFVVDSSPRQAMVYVNNVAYGPSPATVPFTYYGTYDITLVREGFEIEKISQKVEAPWYAYPPVDFFAEVLNPFKVEDVHRFYYEMKKSLPPDVAQLQSDAAMLREAGLAVPDPKYPPDSKRDRRREPRNPSPPQADPALPPAPAIELP